mgnify:CR=1 FL=1
MAMMASQPVQPGSAQLGPQAADVDGQAVGFRTERQAPDIAAQFVRRNGYAGILGQPPQQQEFARVQPGRAARHEGVADHQVQPQRPDPAFARQRAGLGDQPQRARLDFGECYRRSQHIAKAQPEQARAGLAIITSRLPGTEELLTHDVDALLVPKVVVANQTRVLEAVVDEVLEALPAEVHEALEDVTIYALEDLGSTDEDAQLRAAAAGDDDRGRSRKSQCTRAGDDEDGDRMADCGGRVSAGEHPDPEGAERDEDHDGHEDRGDPVSQTLTWKMDVPAVAAAQMLPGQQTRVRFVGGEAQRMVVPQAAVLRRGELTGVYVAGDKGFVLKAVRLGVQHGDRIEVLAGLKAGDAVAVNAIQAGLAGAQIAK